MNLRCVVNNANRFLVRVDRPWRHVKEAAGIPWEMRLVIIVTPAHGSFVLGRILRSLDAGGNLPRRYLANTFEGTSFGMTDNRLAYWESARDAVEFMLEIEGFPHLRGTWVDEDDSE